jgi:hypothetical protein
MLGSNIAIVKIHYHDFSKIASFMCFENVACSAWAGGWSLFWKRLLHTPCSLVEMNHDFLWVFRKIGS